MTELPGLGPQMGLSWPALHTKASNKITVAAKALFNTIWKWPILERIHALRDCGRLRQRGT